MHSLSIDLQQVINQHNENAEDGSVLVLLPARAVEFAEKIANDNGSSDIAAAVGSIIAQAEMYHAQYEANMINRFVEEGRVRVTTNQPATEAAPAGPQNLQDIMRQVMSGGTPIMGMACIEADSLPEALAKFGTTFGVDLSGLSAAMKPAGEPDAVVKARETIARFEAEQAAK